MSSYPTPLFKEENQYSERPRGLAKVAQEVSSTFDLLLGEK